MGTVTSANSTTASVTPTGTDWWLSDPTDPTLAAVLVVTGQKVAADQGQGVFRPLGRRLPVVVSDAVHGDDGTVDVQTFTEAAYRRITALRATQRTLLLQNPMGEQWYIRPAALPAAVTTAVGTTIARNLTLSYIEVDRP